MNNKCKDKIINVFFPMYKIIFLYIWLPFKVDKIISPNDPDIDTKI